MVGTGRNSYPRAVDVTPTASSAQDHRSAAEEDTAYAWRVLSVTSLGVILTSLNSSTLEVGLPAVARHFRPSPAQASWFLLAYLLVSTVLILVFGRLADMVGRRLLYVLGLVTFTAASLGCGLAPSASALIGLRALQAVGAAAIITNTTAQLTDAFPRRLLGTALGLNITVISAAQIAGPVVGGALVAQLGWRWIFLFNVPVGVLGIVWASIALRKSTAPPAPGRFDVSGALLTVLWLGGLVVALSEGGAQGWSAPWALAGFSTLALALPAFVLRQRRARDPLVDLALFRDRHRSIAFGSNFGLAIARYALLLLASLFFQAAQGLDPLAAGLRVTPLAIGLMVASPIAGQLVSRVDARLVSTVGVSIVALGLAVMAVAISPNVAYWPMGLALFAVGIGTGTFMTPNTSAIMSSVPATMRGVANGLRSMLQNTGFVVSTAMSLAIITSPLTHNQKQAAYSGTLSRLPGHQLDRFVGGYRAALLVLFAICVAAAVGSALRGRGQGAAAPADSVTGAAEP